MQPPFQKQKQKTPLPLGTELTQWLFIDNSRGIFLWQFQREHAIEM
jgi:hypothetical protein